MDNLQTTATSLAIIAIIVLMVVFVCHYLGPRVTVWVRSNREEKIGLSKSKLFNANGYMIHSGSDFLLSSSGSFKRFDSIDRDYKQVGQSSLTSPSWNIPQTDIPPQPLRPAPAPNQLNTKFKDNHEKPIPRQNTLDTNNEKQFTTIMIPRPTVKKQLTISNTNNNNNEDSNKIYSNHINLSDTVEKIRNESRINTNPFLNGTLALLSLNSDNPTNCDITTDYSSFQNNFSFSSSSSQIVQSQQIDYNNVVTCINSINSCNSNKNPFTSDCVLTREKIKEDEFIIEKFPTPKTDVGERSYFNFEPDKITSFLSSTMKQISPQHSIKNDKEYQQEEMTTEQNQSHQHEYHLKQSSQQHQKFLDSPCADAFENIEKMLKRHFRNRSFSDTETTVPDLRTFTNSSNYFKSQSTNPFLDKNSLMHKTFSENYLFKNNNTYNISNNNEIMNFGRSLSRQESNFPLGRRNSSQSSLDEKGSMESINLQRALSCDSVNSESSVVLSDLEQTTPQVTGYLCVGLQCDKNSITDEGMELMVTVMEAKELIGPPNVETFDTFVRIYLVPDETGAMQTKLFKNSSSPSYNETFCFWLNKKRGRHSLWFHLYHSGSTRTLIGETEMQICDVSHPITTWLPLSDSIQNNVNWGELMFSLSYLPTAERLTVVVVKARNLKLDEDGREASELQQNIFVKVYLLKNERKVTKKKTSLKRTDRCPIFNESMIFSIPPYILKSIQIRLTVMSVSSDNADMIPIGHVIVGSNTNGKSLKHWHQMLSSLRKPVAMWHQLRRTITKNHKKEIT